MPKNFGDGCRIKNVLPPKVRTQRWSKLSQIHFKIHTNDLYESTMVHKILLGFLHYLSCWVTIYYDISV